jgi:ankyrin repeat protein
VKRRTQATIAVSLLIALTTSRLAIAAGRTWAAPPRAQTRRLTPIISLNLDPQESANTALRIASRAGQLDGMEYALKRGAKVDGQSIEGTTALMYAAQGCYTDALSRLLTLEANINIRDKKNRTALMLAIRGSCLPVVRILLTRPRIDLLGRDYRNRSIRDFAVAAAALDADGPSIEILSLIRKKYRKTKYRQADRAERSCGLSP